MRLKKISNLNITSDVSNFNKNTIDISVALQLVEEMMQKFITLLSKKIQFYYWWKPARPEWILLS